MNVLSHRGPWIQTYTGKKFYPLDPRAEEVNINDIAYVLAGEWRFGGHCSPRISVAQHSVMVSEHLPLNLALWGLLHDASEAYVRDLNRPIKQRLPEYKSIENRIMEVIAEKFNLPWPMPDEIHTPDERVMAGEANVCMAPLQPGFYSSCGHEPVVYEGHVIRPWGCKKAYRKFLHRFGELNLLHECHRETNNTVEVGY
jgi:hypothetical protein